MQSDSERFPTNYHRQALQAFAACGSGQRLNVMRRCGINYMGERRTMRPDQLIRSVVDEVMVRGIEGAFIHACGIVVDK